HEPLVSYEIFRRAQNRLEGRAYAPDRRDAHLDFPLRDFPLRGIVACAACGETMTAAWSKGRDRHYPYYVCKTKGCVRRGKSLRKETVESAFEALLRQLQPAPVLFKVMAAMLRDLWDHRVAHAGLDAVAAKRDLSAVERKISALVERILKTDSTSLVTAYEAQLRKLEETRALLAERATPPVTPKGSFDEVYRTATVFLAKPWKLWAYGGFEHKRLVAKLAFTGPLPYCPNEGYRTANMALPFKVLAEISSRNSSMVEGAGFEPA
ncbi:MAG: zinc ribbon domain-containing protein, partial [Pseudomonadota bacterium]